MTRADIPPLLVGEGHLCLVGCDLVELALEELLACGRTGAQGDAKELVGATGLHVLLVQEIKKQVLITLDESL